MKNIPLTQLARRPVPLNVNIPATHQMMKALPQSKWTYAVSPFPQTFCKIDERAGTCSFYLPGETVTFKDGTEYTVQHDCSIRKNTP